MANETGVTVHADFLDDVRVHALQMLTQAGISIPAAARGDVHLVCRSYFNVANRVIEPRPRRVHRSRELLGRPFSADVVAGVQLIEARSIAGDTLALHLSERAMRPHTHDWLLSDWGIHHLHVRPQRGDELLYTLVEPNDLYLIDVRGHGAMADTAMLEIVLANWPTLLRQLVGLRGSADGQNPSAAELQQARRHGVQCMLTLSDGKVYGPRGGGLTTAGGSSGRVVFQTDEMLRRARTVEANCRAHASGLAEALNVKALHLRYDPGAGSVIETKTGHVWPAR